MNVFFCVDSALDLDLCVWMSNVWLFPKISHVTQMTEHQTMLLCLVNWWKWFKENDDTKLPLWYSFAVVAGNWKLATRQYNQSDRRIMWSVIILGEIEQYNCTAISHDPWYWVCVRMVCMLLIIYSLFGFEHVRKDLATDMCG